MAFVHDCSTECMKSELDLFSVPPTQTSVESSSYNVYHPLNSISDCTSIEFEISGNGEDYIDLSNTFLHVSAKIVKQNGSDIEEASVVGPINNFLPSLFSQLDITLNGTLITSSTNMYPYRAIIETLLSYGTDAKKSQLTAGLFFKDRAGQMDSVELDGDNVNDGFLTRRAFCARSRTVDMMGRVHADLFYQDRFMLNEVTIALKFTRSKDAFCLMSDSKFKVKIVKAELVVRKVKLSPSVFLAHAKALEYGTAKYPIKRIVCKSFTVPAGFLDINHEKLFTGALPSRLVIGLIDNEAFNGSFARNPFNFQHFNLTDVGLYLDGQQAYGIKPIHTDFESKHFVDAYLSLFTGSNKIYRDEGNFINRLEYGDGYTLFAYDLTPDLAEDTHFNLSKNGNVRLLLKFATALARAVSVVVFGEFENVVEIDRNRNIIYDFSS